MLNFCMTNAFFHPFIGGTEKMMLELGKRLAKKTNFHVLTSALPEAPESEIYENMTIHRVPATLQRMPYLYPPPMVFAPQARKYLRELDQEQDFDVFNCHGRWFPDFAYSIKYAHKNHKYSTLTLHNKRPHGIQKRLTAIGLMYEYWYGINIMKQATKVIAVSEGGKRDVMKYGIPESHFEVIHNGVDTNKVKQAEPTYREKYADGFDHVIGFQGRVIKQKGIDYLIDAMPSILDEFPKTKLLIVGKGKMLPELEKQVSKNGLRDNITFTGFIPEEEINNMFSSLDVFVMPSLWEVLCVALLEAMSCGVPLVATNATGNDEIVKDGVNGYVVPMRQPDALAEKIKTLLRDDALRKKMAKNSRDIAVKNFEWDIIAKQTLDFYERETNEFYKTR